jgi:hypothetical protein
MLSEENQHQHIFFMFKNKSNKKMFKNVNLWALIIISFSFLLIDKTFSEDETSRSIKGIFRI